MEGVVTGTREPTNAQKFVVFVKKTDDGDTHAIFMLPGHRSFSNGNFFGGYLAVKKDTEKVFPLNLEHSELDWANKKIVFKLEFENEDNEPSTYITRLVRSFSPVKSTGRLF